MDIVRTTRFSLEETDRLKSILRREVEQPTLFVERRSIGRVLLGVLESSSDRQDWSARNADELLHILRREQTAPYALTKEKLVAEHLATVLVDAGGEE
jgi:hypothetical protein